MRAGLQMTQNLSMKMMLKPELQQSLQLLQLSCADLYRYLNELAMENPVLEVEPPALLERGRRQAARRCTGSADWDPLRGVQARKDTLEADLLSQLRVSGAPREIYRTAAFLAGNVDDAGYLRITAEEAAALLRKPAEHVEQALERLQGLEPAGVGARDLRECLLLQIRRDPLAPAGCVAVVEHCLPMLGQGKLDRIASQLGMTSGEVQQAADYIRSLDPRPCAAIAGEPPSYVVPDAYIRREGEAWAIRLNAASVPGVTVNRAYAGALTPGAEHDTAPYLKDKLRAATLLLQGLKQRQVTLYRVIDAILAEQPYFLEQGERGIKPLTLHTVAERLQFHESTVSRAVQNKYVGTPYGVYELKFFFGSGIATEDGEYASMRQIKLRIKELIAGENKRHPLSDRQIVELLAEEGVKIARRTVAKYREELNLLSSALRKSM